MKIEVNKKNAAIPASELVPGKVYREGNAAENLVLATDEGTVVWLSSGTEIEADLLHLYRYYEVDAKVVVES